MKNKQEIKREVNDTLHSLDKIERARTDDFFFGRLEARLDYDRQSAPSRATLAYTVAAFCLLILFNVLTVLHYQQSLETVETEQQQNLEAFADEYNLEIPTIYEWESEE